MMSSITSCPNVCTHCGQLYCHTSNEFESLNERLSDNDPSLMRLILLRVANWDPLLEALAEHDHVDTVDLKWNRFKKQDAVALGKTIGGHTNIKALRIARCRWERGASLHHMLEQVADSTSLQKIYLWQCDLQMKDIEALCMIIRKVPSLKFICLANNDEQDLLVPLFQCIAVCGNIRKLRVWSPRVQSAFPFSSLWGLVYMLKKNTRLRMLDLDSIGLGDTGANAVAKILSEHNNTLEVLDLGRNNLTATASLGKMLTSNGTLQELNLKDNRLSKHLKPLLDGLKENRSLTSLNLDNNGLNEEDVRLLTDFLCDSRHCHLGQLSLSDNRISNAGATMIAHALTRNKTLKALWIHRNHMAQSGVEEFGKCLPSISLRILGISGNRCEPDGQEVILEGLKQNYTLHHLSVSLFQADTIAYYTKLNRAGRRVLSLDQGLVPGVWAELLGRKTSSLDSLFYFLKEMPELCSYGRQS